MLPSRSFVLALVAGWCFYPARAEAQGTVSVTGSLNAARSGHTSTLLPNGKVLVAGGGDFSGALATAELYDPATSTWSPTGSLTNGRSGHTASLLPNGKVLIAGGSSGLTYFATAELYDPVSGTWTATGALGAVRGDHTATLLPSGKVLVAGGSVWGCCGVVWVSSAELFDPALGSWAAVGALAAARSNHTATLLPGGKVLVAGGFNGGRLAGAELFDPALNTWTATGSLATGRSDHTATLLPSGKVLVGGGMGPLSSLGGAELYDPALGTWTATGSLATARYRHSATLLPSGKVLVTGGANDSAPALGSAELYDPALGTWTSQPSLAETRSSHTATLLPGGKVLAAGGTNLATGYVGSAELYDPGNGTWTPTGSLAAARSAHSATLLPSGKVLVAGGYGAVALSGAELYDPALGAWSATGSLGLARGDHTATLLPSGKVLVVGGSNTGAQGVTSAELYDPASGSWTATGSLSVARYRHTATLLPSGRVLAAGGWSTPGQRLASAEIYDPANGTWTATGSLQGARGEHMATLLPSGTVLVAGGSAVGGSAEIYDPAGGTWTATGSLAFANGERSVLLPSGQVLAAGGSRASLYDAATGTWAVTGSVQTGRSLHTVTLLASGKALAVGGTDFVGGNFASALAYDFTSHTWTTAGSLAAARYGHTATRLLSGTVLIAGGTRDGVGPLPTAELYGEESAATQARRPSILTLPQTIAFGVPVAVSGHFRGDSEAGAGSTPGSAANQPLIEMESAESGRRLTIRYDPRLNFWDDPMTLALSDLPSDLDPGWQRVAVSVTGIRSPALFVRLDCSVAITASPQNVTLPLGATASFAVAAQGARRYRWQSNFGGGWEDIASATGPTYVISQVLAAHSGAKFRALVTGACPSPVVTSGEATLTVQDDQSPTAAVISPSGGEYWLQSPLVGSPTFQVVSWSMADDVRVCQVTASLLYSNDGGTTYLGAPAGGGLPATFGAGGSCVHPGVTTTNLVYTVPTSFPSGTSGSLYKLEIRVTDQIGHQVTARSANPFYIVQANPDNVRTVILSNVGRMQSRQGISSGEASALTAKLLELAAHPRVQGVVVDLGPVTALNTLYAAYDAAVTANNGTSVARANDVLFAANGIHDYLRSLLAAFTGARYLVLVGDDRIIPFARMPDGTVLLRESAYPAGGDLRAGATGVGQALAANSYLSDDPLAVRDALLPAELAGSVFVPDLAVGRLVETPQEITTSIATFIGQNGILDVSVLDANTGHKALVAGYDFLTDGAKSVRTKWKSIFGVNTPDGSLAPVDGSLIGGNWGLGTAAARTSALRTHGSGNGGPAYGLVSLSGHAAHYLEGVPGNDFTDIQGLSSSEIYGPDACATPTAGALNLAGSVVYAAGCHGGLAVPGSCRTDLDHSLDLSQTFLARGVMTYVANTGFGWGLRYGIGYGERLGEVMTEELAAAGTVVVGDAVRRTKQRYFLESPRYDPYDQKSLMQWTVYGLPMYSLKTGALGSSLADRPFTGSSPSAATLSLHETRAGVGVRREVSSAGGNAIAGGRLPSGPQAVQPTYLTQVNLTFDLTAGGIYEKKNSLGDPVAGSGCPDSNGCYYTLNGLATGNTDLPIQPYFVYDSRLSGTSQHGVLWKGGTYLEEGGWKPIFSELLSTSGGADGSNHGDAPRLIVIRATAPRLIPGEDLLGCRRSDVEVNSLVVPTGEALKAQSSDLTYSIERHYRTVDLEAFYFDNPGAPGQNCDREGPLIAAGPFAGAYHQVSGRTVTWSVPASDPSGTWRVVVVSSDNAVDGNGRGSWVPTDLTFNPGTGRFEGNRSDFSGSSTRVTYVVQALDNRGNVTWLDYVSASLPASGVPLGVPQPLDVVVAPGTTVTGFAPLSGPVGASVTVTGTNFVGVTQVRFGGVPATAFNAVSSTQLIATVPAGAISGAIEVTASLGMGTSANSFIVQAPPTLTSFTPDHGPAGTLVKLVGTNLAGATAVTFNGAMAVFVEVSPAELQAAVPSGAATGKIALTTPYGTAQSASAFTVTVAGTSTSFDTVTPCRAVDTRTSSPLAAGSSRVLKLAGNCGIPGTARAVSLNVTVTAPTAAGNLQIYPSDVAAPPASALNYGAGQTRGNNAIIAVSASGEITVKANQASGTVHVILDINGYFE